MAFFKYLKYGLATIWQYRRYFYLALVAFWLLIFLFFKVVILPTFIAPNEHLHLGDLLFILLSGQLDKLAFSNSLISELNFLWFTFLLLALALPITYTSKHIYGYGMQLIFRLRKRSIWWLSHTLMLGFMTLFYVLSTYIALSLIALLLGFAPDLDLNQRFLYRFLHLNIDSTLIHFSHLPLHFLLLFPLAIWASLIWQSLIELIVKPIYSYLLAIVFMYISLQLQIGVLFFNSTMLIRLRTYYEGGISVPLAFIMPIIWLIIGVLVGFYIVNKKDILERDGRV